MDFSDGAKEGVGSEEVRRRTLALRLSSSSSSRFLMSSPTPVERATAFKSAEVGGGRFVGWVGGVGRGAAELFFLLFEFFEMADE